MKNNKLGVEILIPDDAKIVEAPSKIEYYTPHYEVLIGIGKDHTMSLYIDEDALEELRKQNQLSFIMNGDRKIYVKENDSN